MFCVQEFVMLTKIYIYRQIKWEENIQAGLIIKFLIPNFLLHVVLSVKNKIKDTFTNEIHSIHAVLGPIHINDLNG